MRTIAALLPMRSLALAGWAGLIVATSSPAFAAAEPTPIPPPAISLMGFGLSFDALKAAASRGDAEAQMALAWRYEAGIGTAVDLAEARKWLEQSVARHHVRAHYLLGEKLRRGAGLPVDIDRAMKLLRFAADKGDDEAALTVYRMLRKGEGAQANEVAAFEWMLAHGMPGLDSYDFLSVDRLPTQAMKQAIPALEKRYRAQADRGSAEGAFRLAEVLACQGLNAHLDEILKRLRQAAKQGHVLAQYRLGGTLISPFVSRRDPAEAYKWLEKAACSGNAPSCRILGSGAKNERQWLEAAVRGGDLQAAQTLAWRYTQGVDVKIDQTRATQWLLYAAERGDSEAVLTLGKAFEQGQGVSRDARTAHRLYQLSAAGQQFEGMRELARTYEQGIGTPCDIDKALAIYRQWDALGLNEANYALGRLFESGEGLAQDWEQAYSRLSRFVAGWEDDNHSTEEALADAHFRLGRMAEAGMGTERDLNGAMLHYAAAGSPQALHHLGELQEQGALGQKNLLQAYKWYWLARQAGDVSLTSRLAELARTLGPAEVARAQKMAKQWLDEQ